MTEHQLIAQSVTYVADVEGALLAAYFGIECHMKQYIAKLFADGCVVVGHKGISQLKYLLYGVGSQRFVGLFAVPRTFYSQFVENVEHTLKSCKLFFTRVHNNEFERKGHYKFTILRTAQTARGL